MHFFTTLLQGVCDFDVLFYIFIVILLLIIIVIVTFTKIFDCFSIYILVYLSDLQYFYIFTFPIMIFPFPMDFCFFSLQRRPLNISSRVDSVLLNSFSFCLCEKVFLSPILNDYLAGQSILACRFFLFLFTTLNISCHSLLACKVSAENQLIT